ncbi:diaminopimelate epimerase [Tumebacillus sp. DT12]|uniref:Diaminopimelate epimerase n=1 Tax=Tumebacillus lacus TaxID=2995335 RepID=A0ABT3WYC7_9BACL|nr:diaminopimelate epimerase [Tumebacillus lacus]MCX7569216.1 diaminopimelate epimerase [Tumebacillus lacus]
MDFYRYHGLGNDYLVMDPNKTQINLTPDAIRAICTAHFGEGSDGILYGPFESDGTLTFHIYNPDGGEAEKSGNGVRIFTRYLIDAGYRKIGEPFEIVTKGGVVRCLVIDKETHLQIEMGTATFPMAPAIEVDGVTYQTTCVSMGNPHCVIPVDDVTAELAKQIGPQIENHSLFPNRTNMQILKVLDRQNIQIEIWERGAGYTLASGSSSCAAAAAARKLGLVDEQVTVHMAGGTLQIKIGDDYGIEMIGPVAAVSSGNFAEEFVRTFDQPHAVGYLSK